MLRSIWQAYNEAHPDKILTNPRSGAAGTLMQKDPEAAAAAGRLLRFFAFGADRDGAAIESASARAGSRTSTTAVCDRRRRGDRRGRARSASGATAWTTTSTARSSACTSPAAFEAAGFNSAEPRGAIAFKYPPEERTTKLLSVEWPVGKIGRVPPRARVEPVFVGGVTVENITLHNPRLIRERDLRIGDTVAVVRRGDVIPFAGPRDRRGPRRQRGGDRPADALPVVRDRSSRSAARGRSAGA